MAKTTAERQAAYRANRCSAGPNGDGERRLNTWVNTATHLALARLARRDKVTQREVIERLIRAEDDGVLAGLAADSPEWDAYFKTT
jgi:uncharacterized protein YhjY with autotransporter beta-barrel domain